MLWSILFDIKNNIYQFFVQCEQVSVKWCTGDVVNGRYVDEYPEECGIKKNVPDINELNKGLNLPLMITSYIHHNSCCLLYALVLYGWIHGPTQKIRINSERKSNSMTATHRGCEWIFHQKYFIYCMIYIYSCHLSHRLDQLLSLQSDEKREKYICIFVERIWCVGAWRKNPSVRLLRSFQKTFSILTK